MKAIVDVGKCQGHARCYAMAPNVFQLDEDGYNQTGETDVPPHQVDEARLGAASCPENAITLVE
jgi:ferredoxin